MDVPSPTEAIIAFGGHGVNQILKNGKNEWEEWERRNCGLFFACVRVNENIFIIGGIRGFDPSTCTDIYNIVSKTWSEGPKLNIARLVKSSLQFVALDLTLNNHNGKR